MNRILLCLACIIAFAFIFIAWEDAEAARFGRGRSFGSKPSMSSPFTRTVPKTAPPSQSGSQFNSQQGARNNQQASGPAGGMARGGMGGMFGGLLAGTLIGSMLFGGGFHGTGFLDILIFGALIYFGLKLLGRRRQAQNNNYQTQAAQPSGPSNSSRGGMSWDNLRENNQQSNYSQTKPQNQSYENNAQSFGNSQDNAQDSTRQNPTVPNDFDSEDFLQGAKILYARLNASWDKRDLDDIAQFSTKTFMQSIYEQAEESPEQGRTDILLVNASLVGVERQDNEEVATVYFSVLLRESDSEIAGDTPLDVQEVWHFTRHFTGQSEWLLDGIQQVQKT